MGVNKLFVFKLLLLMTLFCDLVLPSNTWAAKTSIKRNSQYRSVAQQSAPRPIIPQLSDCIIPIPEGVSNRPLSFYLSPGSFTPPASLHLYNDRPSELEEFIPQRILNLSLENTNCGNRLVSLERNSIDVLHRTHQLYEPNRTQPTISSSNRSYCGITTTHHNICQASVNSLNINTLVILRADHLPSTGIFAPLMAFLRGEVRSLPIEVWHRYEFLVTNQPLFPAAKKVSVYTFETRTFRNNSGETPPDSQSSQTIRYQGYLSYIAIRVENDRARHRSYRELQVAVPDSVNSWIEDLRQKFDRQQSFEWSEFLDRIRHSSKFDWMRNREAQMAQWVRSQNASEIRRLVEQNLRSLTSNILGASDSSVVTRTAAAWWTIRGLDILRHCQGLQRLSDISPEEATSLAERQGEMQSCRRDIRDQLAPVLYQSLEQNARLPLDSKEHVSFRLILSRRERAQYFARVLQSVRGRSLRSDGFSLNEWMILIDELSLLREELSNSHVLTWLGTQPMEGSDQTELNNEKRAFASFFNEILNNELQIPNDTNSINTEILVKKTILLIAWNHYRSFLNLNDANIQQTPAYRGLMEHALNHLRSLGSQPAAQEHSGQQRFTGNFILGLTTTIILNQLLDDTTYEQQACDTIWSQMSSSIMSANFNLIEDNLSVNLENRPQRACMNTLWSLMNLQVEPMASSSSYSSLLDFCQLHPGQNNTLSNGNISELKYCIIRSISPQNTSQNRARAWELLANTISLHGSSFQKFIQIFLGQYRVEQNRESASIWQNALISWINAINIRRRHAQITWPRTLPSAQCFDSVVRILDRLERHDDYFTEIDYNTQISLDRSCRRYMNSIHGIRLSRSLQRILAARNSQAKNFLGCSIEDDFCIDRPESAIQRWMYSRKAIHPFLSSLQPRNVRQRQILEGFRNFPQASYIAEFDRGIQSFIRLFETNASSLSAHSYLESEIRRMGRELLPKLEALLRCHVEPAFRQNLCPAIENVEQEPVIEN